MTVEHLYRAFIEEHKAGGVADPIRYLERVDGIDRMELEALIDTYLSRAPRESFDPAEYAASGAPAVVDALERVLWGEAGMLPAALPNLRKEAQLTRSSLVTRLAEKLGVQGREPKVAAYYHELEHGLLPAERVSPRVFQALGELLGRSAEWLREQSRTAGGTGAPTTGPVFARTGTPDPALRPTDESEPTEARAQRGTWDEIDELFLGGR